MQPHFFLEYYDPPEELRRHLTVLFHFTTELAVFPDRHPGALGQFVIFPKGTGRIMPAGKEFPVEAKAHLTSGFSQVAQFVMDGPWHAIGATFTPLGWAALTGKPASDYIDQFLPAAQLLGEGIEDFAETLSADYLAGRLTGKEACDAFGDWISAHLGKVSPAHEQLIETVIGWLGGSLNPDLDQLFAQLSYSRRQSERLVERFFGMAPAALARKYRAIRAAAMLSTDILTDAEEAAIAEAFYDQPHMVREISRYCGYTPARIGGDGEPVMKTLLQMKNFTRLQEFRAS